jgi:unsaturated rhamnogalacturonyl hydrolase
VLDYLPAGHAGRDSVIALFQRLAVAVRDYQDDSTGVWWQVIDQKNREGNYPEASCSCMFVYALAKGVRKGYIDQGYIETAKKGFRGIVEQFIVENSDGTIDLTQVCESAGLGYGRDGSYDYYVYQTSIQINDGKGVGPFILACIEIESEDRAERVTPDEKNE